jgi:general secretion pathway protein D
VAVRVKLIRTEQQNLQELGFDWLVSPFGLSANHGFASGGTIGNGLARTNADFINPVGSTSIPGIPTTPGQQVSNIVTGGLRSGDGAASGDSIDSLIANPSGRQQNSVAPGVLSLTGLFGDGEVQMILRGLDQTKGIDVMAKPSTVTRSGQTSTIEIVREFIYPTEYEPPELPNTVSSSNGAFPVTPATPTAFETKNTGITLEVLPVANPSKRTIDVTINPSFIEFDGFVNYGSPINTTTTNALGSTIAVPITENAILMPVFSSRRANTQVTIADGATIAIGGLMTDSIQNVEDKVPVLGDLPVMGRLFRSKTKNPVTSALVFLVQVELLDPTGRPYRDR